MSTQQEIAAMNATEYKSFHESFMQNNHGSSAPHVFFCIFFTVQSSVYSSLRLRHNNNNRYLYEYIIIVLPLILAHTILSNYIYFLNFVVTTMLFYEAVQQYPKNKRNINHTIVRNKKIYSISIMRGLTYIITVCAILAVDFRDFPRHLAKTERYGYSLMDTGVGLFVLMSGLVHKDLQNHSVMDIIKGNIKFISVLLILGIARYWSVKHLDYQEHVTEYGVHWNFFFTLAVCKLLATVILYFNVNALLYSFLILLVHEFILYLGVQEWVFSDAQRDTLLSANREGVSSCLGYVSLYLFGAYVKNVLSSSGPITIQLFKKTPFVTDLVQLLLIIASVLLWTLLYVLSTFRPTSRSLANASYCLYLEATLVTVVTMLYYVERALQDEKCTLQEPNIIENVNSNGLSYFLIANLITGAINMSMRTLLASSSVTFLILNVYMMLTLLITMFLKKKGVKI